MQIRYDNDGNAIITMSREAAQRLLVDAALYNSDKARYEQKVNFSQRREDRYGLVECLKERYARLASASDAVKNRKLLASDFTL